MLRGRDGFWLHRLLVGQGIDNHVMDPASLPVDRRTRRVKTNCMDIDGQLRALMAWHRGEARVCSMVRVPSVEEEDARPLTRERKSLLKERLRHTNRIKGLLAGQGIYDFKPLGADRRRALDRLVSGDGRPLAERLKAELGRQLRRLELVCGMLREVEAERDRLARAAARQPRPDDPLALLMRLRSLGAETASVLSLNYSRRGVNLAVSVD